MYVCICTDTDTDMDTGPMEPPLSPPGCATCISFATFVEGRERKHHSVSLSSVCLKIL